MNLLENEFEAAIKSKDLPGAVLTSSNANGKFESAGVSIYQIIKKT